MSVCASIQAAIAAALALPGALRVPAALSDPDMAIAIGTLPIGARRMKEMGKEIEAAAANHGLCIYVMPVLPTRAAGEGVPFVFFEGSDVRVRIIEQPAENSAGASAYQLVDDVALALHWKPKTAEH